MSPTKYWPNGSDKDLVLAAGMVDHALKADFAGVGTDRIGTTDSAVFKKAKIPVLSLHSLTQETWRLINGKTDVWKIVSMKDYYDSHRLICALLVYLDQKLP
jgi:Iap family predicted aminopeptidase